MQYIIITGRTHAGKSTTMNAVCQDLCPEKIEWVNLDDHTLVSKPFDEEILNGTYLLSIAGKKLLVVAGSPSEQKKSIRSIFSVFINLGISLDAAIISCRTREKEYTTKEDLIDMFGPPLEDFRIVRINDPGFEESTNWNDRINTIMRRLTEILFPFNLCQTFKILASETWHAIAETRRMDFAFGEETFTDVHMFNIKRRHEDRVRTYVLNKHEESVLGADWEWWFKSGARYVGVRVQAKIINNATNSFEHLHYKTPKSTVYQCDKLITNAKHHAPPIIPLYALYLHVPREVEIPSVACHVEAESYWGCSLMSAYTVRDFRPKHNSFDDLKKYMMPWHCAVCPPAGTAPLQHVDTSLIKLLDNRPPQLQAIDIPESFITEEPPYYIRQLMNGAGKLLDIVDDDLAGIVIFDIGDQ